MGHGSSPAERREDLLIVLDETRPRTLSVCTIELSLNAVTVRFSATHPCGLEDVFRQEIASIVRSICDGAAHAIGAVERPDFCLRIPGLTLERSSISVSIAETGLRRFQLRIHQATGNSLGIFRISSRTDTGIALFTPRVLTGPAEQIGSQRLFDEMLSQLYLPLVNLNAYLRNLLDGTAPARGESLSHSVVQLKTRAETLQFAFDRLIAEKMVDKYADITAQAPALNSDAA